MVRVGLREANQHFSRCLRVVRKGQDVVLTERGKPVAVIKPLTQRQDTLRLLEEQGLLKRRKKGKFPFPKPVRVSGIPLSQLVIQERNRR